MKVFKRRHLPALAWAFAGFWVAIIGNILMGDLLFEFPQLHHFMRFVDAAFTALVFGFLRYANGEWRLRVEQLYMDKVTEGEVRDALTILRYSVIDTAREKALAIVVQNMAKHGAPRLNTDFEDFFNG